MADPMTHFDENGASRMVDISAKSVSHREATASGQVVMSETTLARIFDRSFEKGDVLEVARLAGIMASKKTGELIPLCHPLALTHAKVDFERLSETTILVRATCSLEGRTGVEMESLTAVAVACLTIYDMCKSIDRAIRIDAIQLDSKTGGKSGTYVREGIANQ